MDYDNIVYIDDKGKLVTIGYKPGFAKSVGYADGGWIDTGRAIPHSWKVVYTKDLEQGVAVPGEHQPHLGDLLRAKLSG